MESSDPYPPVHEFVDVKVEIDPEDFVDDGAKPQEEDEDYRPAGSDHDSESIPTAGEESEIEEPLPSTMGDMEMEGNVINFLAQNKKRKRVRTNPRSGTRFKCDKCTSVFRYQSTLDYHKKSECGTKLIKGSKLVGKGDGKITCNVCEKNFCSRTALMVHMRIHTGERPFSCSLCDRSFFQKAHLNDHVANMHSTGYALCRICNETFRDKLELSKHMKTHREEGSNTFPCQLCQSIFNSRFQRNQHMSKVHNESVTNVVRCGICAEPFDTLALLMKHRADAHPGQHRAVVSETGGVECHECGNRYSGAKQLQAHMRRYHRASLPCPHCPRMLPSKYDLRIHLRSHTGEKPYSCEFCGRSFSRKSVLELHITLHTGTKDFLCCVCGAGFNRKSKLIVHFAEHTNAKFQCKICKKEYKCQSYLKCHMKTHMGPSKCPCCDQPFLSRRTLVNHMKKFHQQWFYGSQKGEAQQDDPDDVEETKDGICDSTETKMEVGDVSEESESKPTRDELVDSKDVIPKQEVNENAEPIVDVKKEVEVKQEDPQVRPNQAEEIVVKPEVEDYDVKSEELDVQTVLHVNENQQPLTLDGPRLTGLVTKKINKVTNVEPMPIYPEVIMSTPVLPPRVQRHPSGPSRAYPLDPMYHVRATRPRNTARRSRGGRYPRLTNTQYPPGFGMPGFPHPTFIPQRTNYPAPPSWSVHHNYAQVSHNFPGYEANHRQDLDDLEDPSIVIPKVELEEGMHNVPLQNDDDDDGEFFSLPPAGDLNPTSRWKNPEVTIVRCPPVNQQCPVPPVTIMPVKKREPAVIPLPSDISIPEMIRSLPPGVGIMPPSHTVFLDEPADYCSPGNR